MEEATRDAAIDGRVSDGASDAAAILEERFEELGDHSDVNHARRVQAALRNIINQLLELA
jgi:hypothetical protein